MRLQHRKRGRATPKMVFRSVGTLDVTSTFGAVCYCVRKKGNNINVLHYTKAPHCSVRLACCSNSHLLFPYSWPAAPNKTIKKTCRRRAGQLNLSGSVRLLPKPYIGKAAHDLDRKTNPSPNLRTAVLHRLPEHRLLTTTITTHARLFKHNAELAQQ